MCEQVWVFITTSVTCFNASCCKSVFCCVFFSSEKMSMIFDSGKMTVLDKLLVKLKQEQHRVLIYSQMTRMIDILEEFMGFRRYRCIRLDGSSRISDRRDMVADFQTK